MQPPQYNQRLSVKTMTTPPFSSTIFTPSELWRHVQNHDDLERITNLLDGRNDIISHLHYFVSLNRSIDHLQAFVNLQRQEMNHVYTELADPFFIGRVGPELFRRRSRQRRTHPYRRPNTSTSSLDSSSERYFSARSSLIIPPDFHHNLSDDPAVPSQPELPTHESDINDSPGSAQNPIDVDAPREHIQRTACPRDGHEDCDWGHPQACISCHGLGHDFADCPIEPIDMQPNDNESPPPILLADADATQPVASGSSIAADSYNWTMAGRLEITCGKCTRRGHKAEDCIFSGPFRCSTCGGRHKARDCRGHHTTRHLS